MTAAMTTAASVACGRSSKSPVRKSSATTVRAAASSPESLRARAGRRVDGRLGEAAADHHAAGQAGGEVRATERDELAVGVDVPGLVGLRRAQPLRERDQHHADPAAGQAAGVGEPDVGQAERRQAARDRPDRRHIEAEGLDRGDRDHDGDEGTRHAGSDPAQAEDHRERARADEQREGVRLIEVGDEVPRLLEEMARATADPEQLRQLADDDREREADDQPLEHRLADEVGEEAEAQQARDQGGGARDDGEPRRHHGEALVPDGDHVRDRCRRQGRGRRHRSHDEDPRAAERGVQQQRAGRGVEADDRRDVRDARVRERLGDEDRPDGESRDQVAAKPAPVIAAKRGEEPRLRAAAHVRCGPNVRHSQRGMITSVTLRSVYERSRTGLDRQWCRPMAPGGARHPSRTRQSASGLAVLLSPLADRARRAPGSDRRTRPAAHTGRRPRSSRRGG